MKRCVVVYLKETKIESKVASTHFVSSFLLLAVGRVMIPNRIYLKLSHGRFYFRWVIRIVTIMKRIKESNVVRSIKLNLRPWRTCIFIE